MVFSPFSKKQNANFHTKIEYRYGKVENVIKIRILFLDFFVVDQIILAKSKKIFFVFLCVSLNSDTINDLHTEVFEAAPQARIIELIIRFYVQIFEMDTNFIDEPIINPSSSTLHYQKESVPNTKDTTLPTSLSLSLSTTTYHNYSNVDDESTDKKPTNSSNETCYKDNNYTNSNFQQQSENSSPTSPSVSSQQQSRPSLTLTTIMNQTSVVPLTTIYSSSPSSLTTTITSKSSEIKQKNIGHNSINNNESISNSQFQHNHSIGNRITSSIISTSSSTTTTNTSSSSESNTSQTRTRHCYNCSRPTTFTFD